MDLADVVRKVKRIFGEGGQVFLTDADVIDWVNDAQLQIVRETGCMSTQVTGNASLFATGFATPTDFFKVHRMLYDKHALLPISTEDLDSKVDHLLDNASSPLFYYVSRNRIWLFPTTAATDLTPIEWTYFLTPAIIPANGLALASPLTIPAMYHEDVVTFCKMRAYERDQNYRAQEMAQTEFSRGISQRFYDQVQQDTTYPVIRDDPWEW